jgi:hypothetical protein
MTRNVPAPATQTDKPPPPKRITKKIRAAVNAQVHGDAKSITEAAEKARLSRSHLSRELGKPHITAHLRHKVLRNLAVNSAKTGATATMPMVDLLTAAGLLSEDRIANFQPPKRWRTKPCRFILITQRLTGCWVASTFIRAVLRKGC